MPNNTVEVNSKSEEHVIRHVKSYKIDLCLGKGWKQWFRTVVLMRMLLSACVMFWLFVLDFFIKLFVSKDQGKYFFREQKIIVNCLVTNVTLKCWLLRKKQSM